MGWTKNSLLQHLEAPRSHCGCVHVKEEARCCERHRPHLLLAHALPRLLLHVHTTTVAPRRLKVLQQRILRPTHPRVALRTLSATAAMDLAICSGIAQAKGHTLQPTTGMLVLLIMKMNILLVLIMQGLVMITTTRMRKFLMRVQRRSTGP